VRPASTAATASASGSGGATSPAASASSGASKAVAAIASASTATAAASDAALYGRVGKRWADGAERRFLPIAIDARGGAGGGGTYLDYMEQHLHRLETGVYELVVPAPVADGQEEDDTALAARVPEINRFAVADPYGSDTVTSGIRIRVSVLHVPEMNGRGKFFFTYSVRVDYVGTGVPDTDPNAAAAPRSSSAGSSGSGGSGGGDSKGFGAAATSSAAAVAVSAASPTARADDFKARLTLRHWMITDALGHTDAVNGPGVVGLYPVVHRGMTPFVYQSCCPLATPTGTMRGAFDFQVIEGPGAAANGEGTRVIAAQIAPFTFDAARNYV
jgi:uncharacterized protein affecting Mg2+/Co2+ transport